MTTTYILSQTFIIISYIFLVMTYQSKNRRNIKERINEKSWN